MTDFSQLLTPKPDLHPTEYFHVLFVGFQSSHGSMLSPKFE
jgi:hypothetical protein